MHSATQTQDCKTVDYGLMIAPATEPIQANYPLEGQWQVYSEAGDELGRVQRRYVVTNNHRRARTPRYGYRWFHTTVDGSGFTSPHGWHGADTRRECLDALIQQSSLGCIRVG